MCKINGHSIFSYMFQPVWNWKKLASSKARDKAVQEAQEESKNTITANSEGEEVAKTATTAKVNTVKTNQTLSSLRKPVGANVDSGALGLNIGT